MVPKHIFEINFIEIKFEIKVAFFRNYKRQMCRSYSCVEIKVFEIPVFEVILLTLFDAIFIKFREYLKAKPRIKNLGIDRHTV